MDGEITPDRDLLSSEISVTLLDTMSHLMPKNSQGESESFHDCKKLRGSLSWFLKLRRASVSTVRGVQGGKK
jgi:hypothetical protein